MTKELFQILSIEENIELAQVMSLIELGHKWSFMKIFGKTSIRSVYAGPEIFQFVFMKLWQWDEFLY